MCEYFIAVVLSVDLHELTYDSMFAFSQYLYILA